MPIQKNASNEETLRAEVECLRKILIEKDKEIQHLKDLLNIYDKNPWSEKKVKVTFDKERKDD